MNAIKDGGPAFPNVPSDPQYQSWDEGMSLRDWFAGQALAGILACSEEGIEWHPSVAAENAFKQADAMLAAREVKP